MRPHLWSFGRVGMVGGREVNHVGHGAAKVVGSLPPALPTSTDWSRESQLWNVNSPCLLVRQEGWAGGWKVLMTATLSSYKTNIFKTQRKESKLPWPHKIQLRCVKYYLNSVGLPCVCALALCYSVGFQ